MCNGVRLNGLLKEMKCIRRTDWENYKKELKNIDCVTLEGKEIQEIDRACRWE